MMVCMDNLELPEDVAADADEVFRFERDVRPQDRAHAYLGRNRIRREPCDTAMLCTVLDLCRRSYAAGIAKGMRGMASDGRVSDAAETAARLARMLAEIEEELL